VRSDLIPSGRVAPQTEFLWYAAQKKPIFRLLERQEDDLESSPPQVVLAGRPEMMFPNQHGRLGLRFYKPLEEERGLFLTFAATPPTPEGVLHFANRYGPLGAGRIKTVLQELSDLEASIFYPEETLEEQKRLLSHPRYGGPRMEAFAAWKDEINWMHHLTGLWRAAEAKDRRALARSISWQGSKIIHSWQPTERFTGEDAVIDPRSTGKEVWDDAILRPWGEDLFRNGELEGPALYFVMRAVNRGIMGAVHPQLGWSVDRRRPELFYRAGGLLGAMCWQFAEALDKGWKYRQCPVCLKTFQLAPGENRADRLTCSNTCRTYLYRRRMEKARELHQQGKTPKQIAKELETTVKTAQHWIAKEK
jgi:hypothetical protein